MAIMAEVEERILRTDSFEDIITCLKSDPANWSDDKLRGLLTAAYLSSVSEEELKLASESVTAGDAAGFSRRGSQISQPSGHLDGGARSEECAGSSSQAATVLGEPHASRVTETSTTAVVDEFADIMKQELEQLQWAGPSLSRVGGADASRGDALDAKSLVVGLRLSGDVRIGRDAHESSQADVDQSTGQNIAGSQKAHGKLTGDADTSAATKVSSSEEAPTSLGDEDK
jgi:hypothetical protein